MTPRERIITTLRNGKPDRVPFSIGFSPRIHQIFQERTGAKCPEEYYQLDFRGVSMLPGKDTVNYSHYFENLPERADFDEWGWASVPGEFEHFRHYRSPLEKATEIKDIEEYPFPDIDASYRYQGLKEEVAMLHERSLAAMAVFGFSTYDISWLIWGVEHFMCDLILRPQVVNRLMDEINTRMVEATRLYVRTGIDIIGWGEDVGCQTGMILSPELWRQYIKPRFSNMIRAAKEENPAVIIWYHSDGNIEPIIPDLIEIGVEVLNPVQPECMDPVLLWKKYGDKMAFWGTIGTQTTMPFGKPHEVRRVVKDRIETIGKDGGLLLSPSHVLEPEVPWENIEAFVEAVRDYGHYRT